MKLQLFTISAREINAQYKHKQNEGNQDKKNQLVHFVTTDHIRMITSAKMINEIE